MTKIETLELLFQSSPLIRPLSFLLYPVAQKVWAIVLMWRADLFHRANQIAEHSLRPLRGLSPTGIVFMGR